MWLGNWLCTGIEQISSYTEDNVSQVSHCWRRELQKQTWGEELQKRKAGKLEGTQGVWLKLEVLV